MKAIDFLGFFPWQQLKILGSQSSISLSHDPFSLKEKFVKADQINCMCMGRFDASGTSKNDNSPKVLVGHGVKKYGIEIFFRGLQAEICLFVYIL